MAEIIQFLEEAWRTLTDSFVLKARICSPYLTITLGGVNGYIERYFSNAY